MPSLIKKNGLEKTKDSIVNKITEVIDDFDFVDIVDIWRYKNPKEFHI